MNLVRKVLLPMGGVVALALIIMIASPRAAHALAAAMVQVMNTPTTAVPALHAPATNEIVTGAAGGSLYSVVGGYGIYETSPVPGGKTLVTETITASANVPHGSGPVMVSFSPQGNAWIFATLPLVQIYSAGGYDLFIGTITGAHLYTTAGSQPSCIFTTSAAPPPTSGSYYCAISGYYVPAQ